MARRRSGRGVAAAGKLELLGRCRDTLYGRRQSYDEMALTVEEMVDRAGASVHALVLRSDNLAKAVRGWTPVQYMLETKKLGGKMVLNLTKRARPLESDNDSIQIAIAEMSDIPDHYCAISDCKSSEFKTVFMSFIHKHSPDISGLYLTSKDMNGVLVGVKSAGYDVDIKYATARSRRQATGVTESHAKSTRMPFDDFFAELDKEGKTAITVRYAAATRPSNGHGTGAFLRGTITRACRFSVAAGAGALFKILIPKAIELSRERNRRIEESAESAGTGMVEPTVINFNKKIFWDKSMNKHYVDILANMPDTSISKYHVNPHIHLSLVDYTDGSSYDIWVVGSTKLTIIPQIRASGASLRRIVNYVFERIGEGRVEAHPYP